MNIEELHAALLSDEPTDRALVDAVARRASAGDSAAARELVNAQDALVELASFAGLDTRGGGGRDALLQAALSAMPKAQAKGGEAPFADPSTLVARKHAESQAEQERASEIEALGAAVERLDPELTMIAGQARNLTGYRVALLAIMAGQRVIHRVVLGMPGEPEQFIVVPRETTFCTHCVFTGEPMRVHAANEEAFFRGNALVQQLGARAYAGVPLRTSRGVVIGTLCLIHDAPRKVMAADLEILGLFAERVVAELERGRAPQLRHELVAELPAYVAANPEGVATAETVLPVGRPAWFRRLIAACARMVAESPAPPSGSELIWIEDVASGAAKLVGELNDTMIPCFSTLGLLGLAQLGLGQSEPGEGGRGRIAAIVRADPAHNLVDRLQRGPSRQVERFTVELAERLSSA